MERRRLIRATALVVLPLAGCLDCVRTRSSARSSLGGGNS